MWWAYTQGAYNRGGGGAYSRRFKVWGNTVIDRFHSRDRWPPSGVVKQYEIFE
jgi:hypothetical protein